MSVSVLVVPRSGRNAVLGLQEDWVRIAVRAPPVDGAANQALTRYLARLFGVRRDHVRIKQGAQARRKRIEVNGISREAVIRALT